LRIHDHLEHWAVTDPGRLCATDGRRTFTYAEMDGWAARVAGVFEGLRISDGDRVGILARNCAEYVAVYYGAFKAGVVPVPLNFRLHRREWAYILNDSGASTVFAQGGYVEGVDAIRNDVAAVRTFVVLDGEAPPGWLALADLGSGDADLTSGADGRAGRQGDVAPDHDLWQMYTSGTTGRPKGAVITHAAAAANVAQFSTALSISAADRVLLVMPMFHVAATLTTFPFIAAGGVLRIVADFDPAECARIIDEERITCAMMAPVMIEALLAGGPGITARRFEHLRLVVYGASAIAEETLRRAMALFRCDFAQGYGQTEAGAALTLLDPNAHRRALAGESHLLSSCGKPVTGTDVAVVDDSGRPVPPGEVGEIIARGPQVMRGYWGLPEATGETLRGGWLHTGDAGRLDNEGFLYICDRIRDMIVSGGENVYPREIEDCLVGMPGVADVAVIGVPDDRWGESVKAVIVPAPGPALSSEAVTGWCRDRLAGYKTPSSVDFVDALPRNATGKVLKTVLREPYWQGRDRRVG
jgi:acyl-CoA synthetase (AMP-forming)/AMP-acid ligase II